MESSAASTKKKVAVFDFDGTSVRGQSGLLFTRYLFWHHMMPPRLLAKLCWWGIRYKLHLPVRQDEARELVFGALSGLTSEEVDAIMRSFHDEVLKPRYRPQALAEVRRCRDEGIVTLLVSATFSSMAEVAARDMGFDGFVATQMERDENGRYTGRVDGPVIAGDEKYNAVIRWCDERFGPGGWELARAYADHYTDEDLLAKADEAFAVCPGQTLYVHARRNGWAILDWRK